MANLRIFDNPKGSWLRSTQFPALGLSGSLMEYTTELAYEDRLTISNKQGDCSVEILSSTNLPNGATVTVDNDTDEVVIAWPAYQVLGTAEASVINPGFESGDTAWDKGLGYRIGTYTWNYGSGEQPQVYDGTKSAEYAKGYRGNSRIMASDRRQCDPSTVVTATCQVQQGPSRINNTGGWVLLQFLDADGVVLSEHAGNAVNSSNDGDWHLSTVTATAPTGTAYARLGAECYRKKENKPMWVDAFAWDLTPAVSEYIGTNLLLDVDLSLRITDAAGRTADWTGTITSALTDGEIAAAIYADLARWWTFDNTVASSVGTAPFSKVGGGDSPSYATGKKNQEFVPEGQYIASSGLGTTDLTFWLWVHVGASGTSRMGLGNNGGGVAVYLWVDILSTTLQLIGYDTSIANYIFSSTSACASGDRKLCMVELDRTSKIASFYLDDPATPVSTITFGTTPTLTQLDVFTVHRLGGGVPSSHPDEWALIPRKLTSGERALLWNGGDGLSFSELEALLP